MSKYTTELRYICQSLIGLKDTTGYPQTNDVIQQAIPLIFEKSIPFYKEEYRNVLFTKILKHYYMREIGAETYGQFKFFLNRKLHEIMPYYNLMYKSADLDFNPLHDTDLTRSNSGKKSDKGTVDTDNRVDTTNNVDTHIDSTVDTTSGDSGKETETGTRKNVDAFSDTPQGSLQNIENLSYLTNGRVINDNNNVQRSTERNGTDKSETVGDTSVSGNTEVVGSNIVNTDMTTTEEFLEEIKGKQGGGSFSKMIMEYREALVNVDMLIIDELEELFMGLW